MGRDLKTHQAADKITGFYLKACTQVDPGLWIYDDHYVTQKFGIYTKCVPRGNISYRMCPWECL